MELVFDIIDFKVTEWNKPLWSAIITVIGVYFWYVVLRIILVHLDNFLIVSLYAFGSGLGCYVGMKVMCRVKDNKRTSREDKT